MTSRSKPLIACSRRCACSSARASRAAERACLYIRAHDKRAPLLAHDDPEPAQAGISRASPAQRPGELVALKPSLGDVDGPPVACAVAHLLPLLHTTRHSPKR